MSIEYVKLKPSINNYNEGVANELSEEMMGKGEERDRDCLTKELVNKYFRLPETLFSVPEDLRRR